MTATLHAHGDALGISTLSAALGVPRSSDAEGRHRLHQKVHMVPIRPNFQKLHLVACPNLQAHGTQHLVHVSVKHRSPILGWKDQVVQQHRHIVASLHVVAHPSILPPPPQQRRKRRGIDPQND